MNLYIIIQQLLLLLYVQTIYTQSCLCVCTILLLYSNDGTALDRRNREGISVDSQTITKEIRHRKSAILFVLCIQHNLLFAFVFLYSLRNHRNFAPPICIHTHNIRTFYRWFYIIIKKTKCNNNNKTLLGIQRVNNIYKITLNILSDLMS